MKTPWMQLTVVFIIIDFSQFFAARGNTTMSKLFNLVNRKTLLAAAGATLAVSGERSSFGFETHADKKSHFAENSLLTTLPESKIVKKIPSLIDDEKLSLRLYQFQNCPFCCKVRAFLDFYGFGYEIVEVNSVTKREIKFSDYKKVPIVVAKNWQNKQLNDSSFIVSFLRTFFVDPDASLDDIKSFYPIFVSSNDDQGKIFDNDNKYFVMFNEKLTSKTDINARKEEREWRRWVDEKFVHTISPNIYRTLNESLTTFKFFSVNGEWSKVFPTYERLFIEYVGALVMYFVGKKLKNKHDLKMDVRESLYDVCNEWMEAVGPHRRFMGGDLPNLADLAVYGAITSFEGCQAFRDIFDKTQIGPWFAATKSAVEARSGAREFGKA